MAEERVQRRLAAILAADVVGYSRLMGADEDGTRSRFNDCMRTTVEPALKAYSGRLVKTMGDGFLIEFPSVLGAVQAAADIQSGWTRQQEGEPRDRWLELRIGVHSGDVIVEGDDIHGDGVNIAARLEGLAEPAGICVSDVVYAGVRKKLAIEFEDLGERSLKNIAEPVQVFRALLGDPDRKSAGGDDSLFRRPAVAVLPFENMSGEADQEFFADGLAEDLITTLSQWRFFPVIARNSTFAYKGQSPDIRKVGKDLGARYVVEGSVRTSGNRVRVTAQLINTETGHHVWAERYDRAIEDFFDLQDEITQQISAVIAPELDRAEQLRTVGRHPESLNAWECYQRGLSLFVTLKRDEMAEACDLFEKALSLDPTFGRAYVGYAESLWEQMRLGFIEAHWDKAMQAAKRAVELNGDDPLGHFALGLIHMLSRDLQAAISEFEDAIQLNPSFAKGHSYLGNALTGFGRAEEAIPHIEKAIRLNPHDPMIGPTYARLARAYLFLQRHQETVKWAQQGMRHQAHNWPIYASLVSALAHLDRLDEARRVIGEMNKRDDMIEHGQELTVAFIREHTPVTDTGYMEHLLDGLRKAGLPEN